MPTAVALTDARELPARDVGGLRAASRPAGARRWPRSASRSTRRRRRRTSGCACPMATTPASFTELVLEQAGVVISPGPSFGPSGEGFVRLSLTVPDSRLDEAARRIRVPRCGRGIITA